MEEREERFEPKRKGRGKYDDDEHYILSDPFDSKEGEVLGTDWALV